MASLTGYLNAFDSDTTTVDATARTTVGTRAVDANGNEYIYLKGVASTAANSVVTYKGDYTTSLSVANDVGLIAIAMAATVASTWGWYLVKGTGTVVANNAIAANKGLYLTATPGAVDDASVAGDCIFGLTSYGTNIVAGTGTCTILVNYPFVNDGAYLV
jgi:hypothetical protein